MTDGTSGDHAVQLSWCVNEQRAELEGAPNVFRSVINLEMRGSV